MKKRAWLLPLALALLATVAMAGGADKDNQKDKGKDKKPEAARAGALSPEEALRQADEKAAAGDRAGAVALLQPAAAAPGAAGGTAGLRLGNLLAAGHDLDAAIDAWRAAAAKLDGPAKGEALGRAAVLQEARGMAAFTESAKAAGAADAEGAWPAIALSRARAREGQAEDALALAQKAIARSGAGASGGGSASEVGRAAQAAVGRAEEARRNWTAAEAAYRAAGGADGSDVVATVGLARV